jgi:hypothetical protein
MGIMAAFWSAIGVLNMAAKKSEPVASVARLSVKRRRRQPCCWPVTSKTTVPPAAAATTAGVSALQKHTVIDADGYLFTDQHGVFHNDDV